MSHYSAQENNFSFTPAASSPQEMARIFNTAIVATRAEAPRDFSAELYELMQTPAFRCILESIQALSRDQGITEREAADRVIQTFRKVDRVWNDYLVQEGVDRLKSSS